METVQPVGVIFDWNGVLVLDEPAHFSAFASLALQTRRHTLTLEEYEQHCRGRTDVEGVELALRHGIVAGTVSDLVARKRRLYRDQLSKGVSVLAPDVVRVLSLLRGKIPYRVVSASPREEIDLIREAAAVADLLPGDLVESDVPSADRLAALQRGLTAMAVPARNVLLVDDSERNISFGRRLGMATARVGECRDERWTEADYCIRSVGEVIAILPGQGNVQRFHP